MWKSKKQFPVIFLEGIRTVSIAALPVHIAEIGHGAGLSFFIKDIFTEGRGGGKSLQEKLIRADGMAEMRVDVVFPVQNITGQFVCDAEPVRSFAELNPAPFQPVYTKQPLKHGEGMIGRLCQGEELSRKKCQREIRSRVCWEISLSKAINSAPLCFSKKAWISS